MQEGFFDTLSRPQRGGCFAVFRWFGLTARCVVGLAPNLRADPPPERCKPGSQNQRCPAGKSGDGLPQGIGLLKLGLPLNVARVFVSAGEDAAQVLPAQVLHQMVKVPGDILKAVPLCGH